MTTENTAKTTTFTLVNPDGQYLKYFYAKHTDPAQVIQFNVAGSQQRFHTCNSEKAIQRVLDKAIEMSIAAEIASVEISALAELKESTKDLPRLRNMKLVEKVEKPKAEPKAEKQPKAKKSKKAAEPEVTEAPAETAEVVTAPEVEAEKPAPKAKKKSTSKKAKAQPADTTEAEADMLMAAETEAPVLEAANA